MYFFILRDTKRILREKSTQIINFAVETEIRKMQDILLATFYF